MSRRIDGTPPVGKGGFSQKPEPSDPLKALAGKVSGLADTPAGNTVVGKPTRSQLLKESGRLQRTGIEQPTRKKTQHGKEASPELRDLAARTETAFKKAIGE